MKLKEIKQHNTISIIIIAALILSDLISYYLSYFAVSLIKQKYIIIESPYLLIIGMLLIFRFFDMYNPSFLKSRSREIKMLFNIIFIIMILYIIIKIFFVKINISHLQDIILLSSLFFSSAITLRLIIRTLQKQLLKINIGSRKVIIVGAGKNTEKLINQMNNINIFGYNIIGYFYFNNDSKISETYNYLGNLNQIYSFVNDNNINEVFITLDKKEDLLNIISNLKNLNVCIKIIPDIYEVLIGQAKMHSVTGMPLIDVNPNILTEFQFLLKRFLDFSISLLALILLSPLLFIVALIIKYDSKGPIIFKQKRVGLNGKEFFVHKLRTMIVDSEKETGPVWAQKEDPRITRVGKILRKMRIDEFPQLYDVLIGNMSIVGPRPERKFFVSQLKEKFPYYMRRLNIRPGITGWAQIMGSYDTDLDNVENKLKLDFYYIENISIWLDIKIMVITFWVILTGKGQ